MSGCLTITTSDPVYRAALEHPKSTPAFEPRVLQKVAAFLHQQTEQLRSNWQDLPESEHSWWVAWANDELPKSGAIGSAWGALFVGFTLVNMVLHRDDALELLTAGRMLRRTIIDLRSKEVWDAALADADFVEASKKGFGDLAAGRVSVVSLKDLVAFSRDFWSMLDSQRTTKPVVNRAQFWAARSRSISTKSDPGAVGAWLKSTSRAIFVRVSRK